MGEFSISLLDSKQKWAPVMQPGIWPNCLSRKGRHARKTITSHPTSEQAPALLLCPLSPWHFIEGELLEPSPLTSVLSDGFIISSRSGFMSLQLRRSFCFHYQTHFKGNAQSIADSTGSSSPEEIPLAHYSYKTAITQTKYVMSSGTTKQIIDSLESKCS